MVTGVDPQLAALTQEVNELREARAVLETVLRSVPGYLVRISLDGTIRFINRTGAGYDVGQVVGAKVFDFTPARYHEAMRSCFAQVAATGAVGSYESEARTADGTLASYYTQVGAIQTDGVTSELLLAVTDVTELKQVNRALDEHHTQLELARAASGIGFWTWDVVADRVTWDATTADLFGVEPSRIPHTYGEFLERVHPADRDGIRERVMVAQTTGVYRGFEFRTVTAAGEERWLLVSGAVVRADDGAIVALRGGIVDITHRKRLEEVLARTWRFEALGQLAAGVAHNFNNMLAAIIPSVELAARRAPDAAELLGIVRQSAERAAGVVRQLMAFAGRRTNATLAIEPVADIARRTVQLVEAMLELPGAITVDAAPGLHAAVDASEVEQALMNLMINARDAVESVDAPRIAIRVDDQPAPGSAGSWVRIQVTDNGTGMDEDTRRRAIEPFFTTKGPGHGTGLGLSSVYALARAAGGHFDLATADGGGTTARLYLPAAPPGTPTATDPAVLRGHGEQVMIVDDDARVGGMLARILADAGYRARASTDLDEVLAAWNRDGGFDVVVLDTSARGAAGVREVLIRSPAVRVISMSGFELAEDGAADHLSKPVSAGALLRALRRVLGR